MNTIHISQVRVNDRQRQEYGEVPELANSMADPRFGQLQPIRLDRENNLVAGGRRIAAAALLASNKAGIFGLEPGHIWFEYKDVADKEHGKEIELEENLQRKDLTMMEKQQAIADLHAIKMKKNPDWNAEKTAEMIGKSKRTVYNAIELAKAVEAHPEIGKAETAVGAMQRLTRIKDLDKRETDIKVAALAKGLGMENKTTAVIKHMDALDGMMELESESVDGVIFNPPFGVNIESLFTSDKKIYQNDDPMDMTLLTDRIVEQAYRVLKPDRWMVMFYPTVRLEDVKGIGPAMWDSIKREVETLDREFQGTGLVVSNRLGQFLERLEGVCGGMLRRHGFSFQQVPCQWVKPNKRVSSLGDPYAQVNINYESFYFARKGKAQLRKVPASTTFVYDTPGTNRIHPLEMPVEFWEEILEAISVGGETVVEPFAGSGAGGEAAVKRGVNYLGWEIDGEFALHAQTRLVGALAGALSKPKSSGKASKSDEDGSSTPQAKPLRFSKSASGSLIIDTTDLDEFED